MPVQADQRVPVQYMPETSTASTQAPGRVASAGQSRSAAVGDGLESAGHAASPGAVVNDHGLDGPEDQSVALARSQLSPEAQGELRTFAGAIRTKVEKGNIAGIQSDWAKTLSGIPAVGGMDVNALVMLVLRESYQEGLKGLELYAGKVRFFNKLKKGIREELTRFRTEVASGQYQGDGDNAILKKNGENHVLSGYDFGDNPDQNGNIRRTHADIRHNGAGANDDNWTASSHKKDHDAYIEKLETKLQSVGDDSQLANTDLQGMLQKQQQLIQMMSTIDKVLHDTAMAVIRKMG